MAKQGLLGFLNPRLGHGLLGLSAGLLGQGATPYPQSFGAGLGRGLLGFAQGMRDYDDSELQEQLMALREREVDLSGKRLTVEERQLEAEQAQALAWQDLWNDFITDPSADPADSIDGRGPTPSSVVEPTQNLDPEYNAAGTRRAATLAAAPAVTTGAQRLPRGLRNNNPGNIIKTDVAWTGEVEGEDSRFKTFGTPEAGLGAMADLLQRYQSKHGLKTLRQVIDRWAPPSENDTGSYVQAVASAAGLGPDDPLDLNDPGTLSAVMGAMIQHENGQNPFTGEQIAAAIKGEAMPGSTQQAERDANVGGGILKVRGGVQKKGGLLGNLTADQKRLLQLLGPEKGAALLAQQAFEDEDAPAPINLNGLLIDPETLQPLADYREPPPLPGAPTIEDFAQSDGSVIQKQWDGSKWVPVGEKPAPAKNPEWIDLQGPNGEVRTFNEADPQVEQLLGTGQWRRAPSPSTSITVEPPEKYRAKAAEEMAKADVGMLSEMGEQLRQSRAVGDMLSTLSREAKNFPTGFGGEYALQGAKLLQRLGVEGLENVTSSGEVIQALQQQLASLQRIPGSGATTDFEMRLYLASVPGLSTTQEGIAKLSDWGQRLLKKRQAEYGFLRQQMSDDGLPPDVFDLMDEMVPPTFSPEELAEMEAAAGAGAQESRQEQPGGPVVEWRLDDNGVPVWGQ